jgi:hypothetical protein
MEKSSISTRFLRHNFTKVLEALNKNKKPIELTYYNNTIALIVPIELVKEQKQSNDTDLGSLIKNLHGAFADKEIKDYKGNYLKELKEKYE